MQFTIWILIIVMWIKWLLFTSWELKFSYILEHVLPLLSACYNNYCAGFTPPFPRWLFLPMPPWLCRLCGWVWGAPGSWLCFLCMSTCSHMSTGCKIEQRTNTNFYWLYVPNTCSVEHRYTQSIHACVVTCYAWMEWCGGRYEASRWIWNTVYIHQSPL